VGPFEVFDARAALSKAVFDLSAISAYRSAGESERASRFSLEGVRDAVVLAVIELYLRGTAAAARVETASAQLRTADAAYRQAVNQKEAGVVAGIDVLRAQVQQQAQQQRLIALRNEEQRSLLDLARAIGLPLEQSFRLSDRVPFAPGPDLQLAAALKRAYDGRSDYQAALAAERAALLERRAAESQRYPAVYASGNYGTIGPSVTDSHGTYTATVGVQFPIFEGGRIRADVMRADAVVHQRQAEAADLRGRIEYEVRNAFRDLESAREQVDVAQSTVKLAAETLTQAQDRFQAGVANNLEVVQAQEAVTTSNENLISSLYVYNVAKASLARAVGEIRTAYPKYLGLSSQ
jgi:outer membrane protein TolC